MGCNPLITPPLILTIPHIYIYIYIVYRMCWYWGEGFDVGLNGLPGASFIGRCGHEVYELKSFLLVSPLFPYHNSSLHHSSSRSLDYSSNIFWALGALGILGTKLVQRITLSCRPPHCLTSKNLYKESVPEPCDPKAQSRGDYALE